MQILHYKNMKIFRKLIGLGILSTMLTGSASPVAAVSKVAEPVISAVENIDTTSAINTAGDILSNVGTVMSNYNTTEINEEPVLSVTGTTLGEYMKSVYTYSVSPEFDQAVFYALDLIDQNQNSNQPITVYTSSNKEDVLKFRENFNGNFGYTPDFRVKAYQKQNGEFCAIFDGHGMTSQLINEYFQKVARVKAIADSLKGNTDDETVENICRYITTNIQYDYDMVNYADQDKIRGYYSIFDDTNKTICYGFAMAAHHLATMDGIPVTIERGVYISKDNKENPHGWNTIMYHGSMHTCDLTNGVKLYETKPANYHKKALGGE